MSRSKDSNVGKSNHSMGGPSRIANFSPFRRGPSFGQPSGSSSTESMISGRGRGLGDVSEVPSVVGKTAPPIKPPKPVGLRVKKAKALSISLLTGSTGNLHNDMSMNRDDIEGSTSVKEKRQSRILLPLNPQKQYDDDDFAGRDFPARSKSALDHYKEHGPTKGLASPQWHDLEARDGLYSKKKKLSDWDKGRHEDKLHSDELFIISRRPSEAETTSLDNASGSGSSMKAVDQSSNLLVDGQMAKNQKIKSTTTTTSFFPSYSDPPSALSSTDPGYTHRENSSAAKPRSQSSLGMYSSDKTAKPYFGSSATPFLNLYTAKGQWSPVDASANVKKKSSPSSPLASLTRRNSFFSNLDRAPNSAPMSSSTDTSQQLPKNHTRTSSTISNNKFISHIPLAKPPSRNRTQSYAGFLAPQRSGSLSTKSHDVTMERASSPLLPPPQQRKQSSRMTNNDGLLRVPMTNNRLEDTHPHPRSSSPFDRGALQAIGQQLGGIGAAVGKRGWDMMKSWNHASNGHSSPLSPLSARGSTSSTPSSSFLETNEATKKWNEAVEPPVSSIPTKGGAVLAPGQAAPRLVATSAGQGGGVFGKPLREAVLISRLAERSSKTSNARIQLSALDLGNKFSIDLPKMGSSEGEEEKILQRERLLADRLEARRQYLPAVVTRCVEAIEKGGIDEEGIYRLSGRSSHTAKLKLIFDSVRPGADLQLVDIGPAELDLNSVCSILKAYLRALPDLLLTSQLSGEFNEAVRGACGLAALSEMTNINQNSQEPINLLKQGRKETDVTATLPTDQENHTRRIATAIQPLMNRLPAVNWYLLREIAYHLGDLTKEDIVRKTKMPLSNLCLVLAPTLSLSVVMVRVMVQAREQLFNDTWPLPDPDLDHGSSSLQSSIPPKIPVRPAKGNYDDFPVVMARDSSRPSARLGFSDNDGDCSKRTSLATVKMPSDSERRGSSGSMATLQERGKRVVNDANNGNRPPTSKVDMNHPPIFSSSQAFDKNKLEEHNNDKVEEETEEAVVSSPIAAHYLRKRSSSIANSIGSTQSSNNSSSRSLQIPKATSSTSLSSNAINSSTMDSSVPSLPDRDSPKTADDHWPSSISHVSNLGFVNSSSNGSLASFYKASIDRPRPTTPNPTRFFSR